MEAKAESAQSLRNRIRREFLDGNAAKKKAMLKAKLVISQGWQYKVAPQKRDKTEQA